jgi:uncharacterized membrane protein YozB (DUF420 family)
MEVYFQSILEQLSVVGFWENSAPLHMDIMVSFLAILPILSGLSILMAIRENLAFHQFTQFLLFLLTVVALGFFAYIVYYTKSFELFVQSSSMDHTIVVIALITHAIIAISTVLLWMFALMYALSDKKRRALPGLYSQSHAKAGRRVFNGILLTGLSGIGIYWMLFLA